MILWFTLCSLLPKLFSSAPCSLVIFAYCPWPPGCFPPFPLLPKTPCGVSSIHHKIVYSNHLSAIGGFQEIFLTQKRYRQTTCIFVVWQRYWPDVRFNK